MDPKGTKPGLMSRTRTAIRRRRKPITIMIVGVLGVYFGSCGVLCLLHPQACFPPGISRGKLPVVFPRGFLFGTATSAHQIEGGNSNNDWWDFENQPGTIKNGDHSGTAADAWNRIPGDIALMKSIGANAYRFSIEWSRLEPQEGTYDQAAFDHYQNELRQLHAAGITPMVTLLHFTLPKWLPTPTMSGFNGVPTAVILPPSQEIPIIHLSACISPCIRSPVPFSRSADF
jgi:hypothetical protein